MNENKNSRHPKITVLEILYYLIFLVVLTIFIIMIIALILFNISIEIPFTMQAFLVYFFYLYPYLIALFFMGFSGILFSIIFKKPKKVKIELITIFFSSIIILWISFGISIWFHSTGIYSD